MRRLIIFNCNIFSLSILFIQALPIFLILFENFNLLCLRCHQIYEFGDKKSMKIYEPNQLIIQKIKSDEI